MMEMCENECSNVQPSEFIFLRIDDKTVKIKRSVLITHSLYFEELLKCRRSSCIISLDNVNYSTFDIILQWMHGYEFDLNSLTLLKGIEVFNTALQLKIINLIIICENFIMKKFMDSEITDIYAFIEQHDTTDTFRILYNILISSFESVVKHPNFLRFNIEFVCMLLSDNDIIIKSEKSVFDAAVQWLHHDWSNRKNYSLRIMACVRMQLLSKQDLLVSSLRTSEFPALEIPEVKDMFLDAFKYLAAVKTSQLSSFPELVPKARTRLQISQEDGKLPRVGDSGNPSIHQNCDVSSDEQENLIHLSKKDETLELNFSEIYSARVSSPPALPSCTFTGRAGKDSIKTKPIQRSNMARWTSSPMCTSRRPLPWQRHLNYYPHLNKEHLAAITLQAFFRGFIIREKLKLINKSARKIQTFYRRWKATQNSKVRKSKDSVTENDLALGILVIGGLDPGHKPLATASTVLYYDPQKNNWTPICATPIPFAQSACAMLNSRVYVTGGVILPTRSTPKSVSRSNWCFNYHTKEWIQRCDMLETRTCHSLIAHNGKLIAIGGKDSSDRLLQTSEFYEPHLDRWFSISSMNIPRMATAATVYKNHIWVCGGATDDTDNNSVTITDSVECYYFNSNRWYIHSPLGIPRMSAMLIALADTMIVVGGAAIDSRIMDAELFIEETDSWTVNHSLQMSRESAAVVTLFDLTFLIGGYSAELNSVLASVQCFLPGLNGEVDNIENLPYPLNGHCAIAV